MTPPDPTDTVAQARDAMVSLLRRYAEIEHPHHDHPAIARKFECDVASDVEDLDALIAAVRAECADKVRGLYDALVTVAEIQERGPDTTIARVHQAYDMRCVARQSLAALEAQ